MLLHLETTLLLSKVINSPLRSRTTRLKDNLGVLLHPANMVLPEDILHLHKDTTSRPSKTLEHPQDSTRLPALASQAHQHKHLLATVHKGLRRLM